MKLGKLVLAVASTTVLLGVLASSASAGKLELSPQTNRVTWNRWTIKQNGATIVDCELVIGGSFHTRTFTKTIGSLIGYITAATVLRCATGRATINQGSLPWHHTYRSFAGLLPRISGFEARVIGVEWRYREPVFGITCTVRREESSTIYTYAVSSGTITNVGISGSSRCGGIELQEEGSTTNVTEGGGARLTVTLI